MKSKAGTLTFALVVALGGAAACAQQPTAPAEPASATADGLGRTAASDSTAAPVTEAPTYKPRKKGIGTE